MPKSLEFPSRLAFNSKSSKVVSFRRKAFERYFGTLVAETQTSSTKDGGDAALLAARLADFLGADDPDRIEMNEFEEDGDEPPGSICDADVLSRIMSCTGMY